MKPARARISGYKRSCFSEFHRKRRTGHRRLRGRWRGAKGAASDQIKMPDLVVITDVCLCEYMSHGHCGVTRIDGDHFHVLNDESVELLAKTALSHAAPARTWSRPAT